jgi:hypothetical protein
MNDNEKKLMKKLIASIDLKAIKKRNKNRRKKQRLLDRAKGKQ